MTRIKLLGLVLALSMGMIATNTACTPVIDGFNEGVQEGVNVVISTLLETSAQYLAEQILGPAQGE